MTNDYAMMTQRQSLEVLARHRGDRVVITTMSSVGIWPELSDSPLDFHYIPSAMGHGPDLALPPPSHAGGRRLGQRSSLTVLSADKASMYEIWKSRAVIAEESAIKLIENTFNGGTEQPEVAHIAMHA